MFMRCLSGGYAVLRWIRAVNAVIMHWLRFCVVESMSMVAVGKHVLLISHNDKGDRPIWRTIVR